MPEGIVPELLIALALLVLVGGVVVSSRRTKPGDPRRPSDESDIAIVDRPEAAEPVVEAEPTELEVAQEPTSPPAVVERPSLRERLTKSRRFLADRLSEALGRGVDDDTWDDIEAVLIQADIGVETSTAIVERLRERARERKVTNPEDLRGLLAEELVGRFETDLDRGLTFSPDGVTVWLIVGVNGTGKTTTIGKLASDLRSRNRSVAMAAADTFRAAADEQLVIWGDRAGAEVVKHQPGADPGAVAYDALQHARARGTDVLLVDTAGRLHTKTPLMDELGKVRRVIEKEGRVSEALLVIDATAGQNGLVQAREFAQAVGVTGIVLTKLDGTAKGGIALTIEDTLDIPIKLVGVGEGIEDLEPFDPKTYVDALLG